MLIDCSTCLAPPSACADCVVTVLLSRPPVAEVAPVDLDDSERAALGLLADAGLVPPLRLIRSLSHGGPGGELSDSA